MGTILDFSAILYRAKALYLGPATARHQAALRVCRAFCNNVDHAIHRIGAPYCPSRPVNNLDALNVLERHVHHVPINSAEKWRIDGPAIDQHQQFVGEL